MQESFLPKPQLVLPPDQRARLRAGCADYIADFITLAEEQDLLDQVDSAGWNCDLPRRRQNYGYRYDYTPHTASEDDHVEALPQWVAGLSQRLVEQKIFTAPPNQMLVNEYPPGQGIAPHTDLDVFGDIVVSLSLSSDCLMQIFPHPQNPQGKFEIVLKRRSLVIFNGKSRYAWRHGIAARQVDQQNGLKIPRQRRVSLTFRCVPAIPSQQD